MSSSSSFSSADPASGSLPKKPGRIESTLLKLFARPATVTAIEDVSPRFRAITIAGDGLASVAWVPGQKVQMALGGFVARTFTPMVWDAKDGSTSILVFMHGTAPGASWAASLTVGASCQIFGPRASLDLTTLRRPAIMFGDETSFGLACSLRATGEGMRDITFLFEVASIAESQMVLRTFGVHDAILVERRPDDGHIAEVETALAEAVGLRTPAQFVLTGKATSIQRLHKFLKGRDIGSAEIKTKAYWAPGKTGLD